MRISDWSSDVCSSDLRDERLASHADEVVELPTPVEDGEALRNAVAALDPVVGVHDGEPGRRAHVGLLVRGQQRVGEHVRRHRTIPVRSIERVYGVCCSPGGGGGGGGIYGGGGAAGGEGGGGRRQ